MLKWDDVTAFAKNENPTPDTKIVKTDEEWREQLSQEVYEVTRLAGTERPFSSEMCTLFEPSLYSCACCNTLLFDAREKFDSGTGWPSFTQPVKQNGVAYHVDNSIPDRERIETVCNTCDAHLGHVFPDGPEPSGLRYCINAVALVKAED
ncbi:peptide-methionine (R)-S-oxide reductase [Leucothrix sargassi]|nr:peptide-methionine (R)-S-oxide reductase [Leucothrix sargassi]